MGTCRLSRANDGRLEVSVGLLVALLRGGVGRYEELSPPDIEVDVDANFGSWAVDAGDGVRLLSGSAAVYSLHGCCFLMDNSQRARGVVYIFLVLGIINPVSQVQVVE